MLPAGTVLTHRLVSSQAKENVMALPTCQHCGARHSITHDTQTQGGVQIKLIYCRNCGAIFGAVNAD